MNHNNKKQKISHQIQINKNNNNNPTAMFSYDENIIKSNG